MVLEEEEYDELIDDYNEELLDGLLALLLFFLSVFVSLDLLLACFSGEESRFAFLADCVVQIPALEGVIILHFLVFPH